MNIISNADTKENDKKYIKSLNVKLNCSLYYNKSECCNEKMLLLDDDITRQLFNVWKLLEHLSSVELNDLNGKDYISFFYLFLASCDCTPPCSDLTTTGTCSQTVDLSNVQCTLSATTTITTTSATTTTTVSSNIPTTAGPDTPAVSTASPSSSNTSNTTSKNSEDVFTVEVIVILCASLLVLCLILVTSTVAIVIYNRNEQLRRQFLKVRKVRPAETA